MMMPLIPQYTYLMGISQEQSSQLYNNTQRRMLSWWKDLYNNNQQDKDFELLNQTGSIFLEWCMLNTLHWLLKCRQYWKKIQDYKLNMVNTLHQLTWYTQLRYM